jgi:hypothetical protein
MRKYILKVLMCVILFQSCANQLSSGEKIELIDCNGNVSRTWYSKGRVWGHSSGGCSFVEKKSGAKLWIHGTLIITEL